MAFRGFAHKPVTLMYQGSGIENLIAIGMYGSTAKDIRISAANNEFRLTWYCPDQPKSGCGWSNYTGNHGEIQYVRWCEY